MQPDTSYRVIATFCQPDLCCLLLTKYVDPGSLLARSDRHDTQGDVWEAGLEAGLEVGRDEGDSQSTRSSMSTANCTLARLKTAHPPLLSLAAQKRGRQTPHPLLSPRGREYPKLDIDSGVKAGGHSAARIGSGSTCTMTISPNCAPTGPSRELKIKLGMAHTCFSIV